LKLKSKNPKSGTTTLVAQIDQLVFTLYGFTEEEIAIIENGYDFD
jgi:adenine-specific DNA-methyltransferase